MMTRRSLGRRLALAAVASVLLACAAPSRGPGATVGSTTGGGGTSSGGTTTGGTTGASPGAPPGVTELSGDGGGCQPNGDPIGARWSLCSDTSQCPCPLRCVYDPRDWGGASLGLGACAPPCQSTSDCALLSAVCDGVGCVPDACGGPQTAFDGGQNGQLLGPCTVNVPGDGVCLPAPIGEGSVDALCVLAGSADAGCDLAATRDQPELICSQGHECLPTKAGGSSGLCVTLCAPGADGGKCAAGEACASFDQGVYAGGGWCVAVTDAGCAAAASSAAGGCVTSADCSCPSECFADPLRPVGGYPGACELPCQSSADCPDPSTVCRSGSCRKNPCSAGPRGEAEPGAIDGPCDSAGQADGTCLQSGVVMTPDGGSLPTGTCWQAGAATGSCDPGATRGDPSLLCPVGSACVLGSDGGGTCEAVCDPTQDGGVCPTATVCFPVSPGDPFGAQAHTGFCAPCLSPGYACDVDAECCGGSCQAGSCR